MSRRLCFVAALACSILASQPAFAAAISRADAAKLLAQASAEVEKAGATRTFEEGEQNLRLATDLYRRLIQGGYQNGYAYYNMGNCYLRLHDVGEAMYWLRMADRWIPQDSRLRANLRFARTQTRVKFPPPPASELLHTLLFFHFLIPFNLRWMIFLVFWNLFWLALILRMYMPALDRRWLLAVFFLVSVMFGLSSGSTLYREKVIEEGIILKDEVVRKGAASTYEPAFTEPVSPGVEVEIMEKRSAYVEVRFTSGAIGWIPSTAVRILTLNPIFD